MGLSNVSELKFPVNVIGLLSLSFAIIFRFLVSEKQSKVYVLFDKSCKF